MDAGYYIVMTFLKAAALLPLRVLYVLSDLLYFIVYRVVRYRTGIVRKNLRNALPERSDEERKRIERAFYHHLCDCIVESIKLLHISDRELLERVEVRNAGFADRMAEEGHPVIMFLGHYGNWEWVQTMSLAFRKPDICGEIYRPLKNKTMDRVMLKIRSRFDTLCIPQKKAFRTLLQLRGEGKKYIIGFIADQYPNSRNRHHWTDFLNQRASYVTGGEEIGRRIDARYCFLEVEKPSRGHYILTLRPLEIAGGEGEGEFPYTLAYLRLLEEQIRRRPEYWLWSHNRWRHKEPAKP